MKIELSDLELNMIISALDKYKRYLEKPECSEAAHKGAEKYMTLSKRLYSELVNKY